MSYALPWLFIASRELGVSEKPGEEASKRIVEYAKTTSLAATSDEVPWCSAFVNWVIKECGYRGTDSAAARSWLGFGKPCELKHGAICILTRGSDPKKGHVGFVIEFDENWISVLGGNQNNSVSIAKYSRSRLLATRWPSEYTGS